MKPTLLLLAVMLTGCAMRQTPQPKWIESHGLATLACPKGYYVEIYSTHTDKFEPARCIKEGQR